MATKRGDYRGDRTFIIRFRAEPRLNDHIRRLAEENQSSIALVVRGLVEFALSQGCQGPGLYSAPAERDTPGNPPSA